MKKIVIVMGDCNDADYVRSVSDLKKKHEKLVRKVAEAIKKQGSQHNWETSEWRDGPRPEEMYSEELTEEEVETFDDEFVPHGEYGIHTIDSIRVLEVNKDEELL